MFSYNSTRSPIILRSYGRHVENLIAEVVKLPEEDKQTAYAEKIVHLMAKIAAAQNDKTSRGPAEFWCNLFIASDYSLKINAPVPLPKKLEVLAPPPKISYQKKQREFRCCGRHLVELIRKLLDDIDQIPNPKESIIALTKLVSFSHKKISALAAIQHIEAVAKKKISFPYEEIEQACAQKMPPRRKRNSSQSKKA